MKTNLLFGAALILGATAIVWMGSGFVGSDSLALTVTVVIGLVYLLGSLELMQFRSATATLSRALNKLPTAPAGESPSLQVWLSQLHPSLHNAAKLRIEGERVGLPAPVFTPYLVGLLIMLGLLGTFVGMVDTLQGAVEALQGSTELEAIRNGLAAPIQGLGLAFGTSVAGVAASAMLGLNATLSRRERMLATRHLDSCGATAFQKHSLAYNRQQTYQAMQDQAQALPGVAQQLTQMAGELERMGNTLSEQLLQNQSQFHDTAKQHYQALAESVGDSLRASLSESGRLAATSMEPIVTSAMDKLSSEASQTHAHISTTTQAQLEAITEQLSSNAATTSAALATSLSGFSTRFEGVSSALLQTFDTASNEWIAAHNSAQEKSYSNTTQALESLSSELTKQWQHAGEKTLALSQNVHQDLSSAANELTASAQATSTDLVANIGELLASSEALVAGRAASESTWLEQQDQRLQQLTQSISEQLSALRSEEVERGIAAQDRLAKLEATAAEHIKALGNELEKPLTRLIETASETPRAAAEVIGTLRKEISNTLARDNDLLEERQSIMQDLSTLSSSLQSASQAQREAIDGLVSSSATVLEEVSSQFSEHITGEANKISDLTATVAGGAADIASMGDAFTLAVELFNQSNQGLIENLQRIEETMDKSTSRSDEQMGYYVAQAREIIDQSMLSQREIIDELRQLGKSGELFPAEAS